MKKFAFCFMLLFLVFNCGKTYASIRVGIVNVQYMPISSLAVSNPRSYHTLDSDIEEHGSYNRLDPDIEEHVGTLGMMFVGAEQKIEATRMVEFSKILVNVVRENGGFDVVDMTGNNMYELFLKHYARPDYNLQNRWEYNYAPAKTKEGMRFSYKHTMAGRDENCSHIISGFYELQETTKNITAFVLLRAINVETGAADGFTAKNTVSITAKAKHKAKDKARGQAVKQAFTEALEEMRVSLSGEIARVAAIQGDRIILNKGLSSGLNKGDVCRIYIEAAASTGATAKTVNIAVAAIVDVQDNSSIA